jgi:hypothetical protein
MKKLLLKTVFLFSVNLLFSQIGGGVVSAPDVVAAVKAQTTTISSDNSEIINELKKMNKNLEESKKLQEEMRDRQKREEDALMQVPMHIKNGNQINTILDKEAIILSMVNKLKNLSNNSSLSNININNIITPILNLMTTKVDGALKIVTDNVYRMTGDERKKYLEEITNHLTKTEVDLQNKISDMEKLLNLEKNDAEAKQKYQEMLNKKITIKKN